MGKMDPAFQSVAFPHASSSSFLPGLKGSGPEIERGSYRVGVSVRTLGSCSLHLLLWVPKNIQWCGAGRDSGIIWPNLLILQMGKLRSRELGGFLKEVVPGSGH